MGLVRIGFANPPESAYFPVRFATHFSTVLMTAMKLTAVSTSLFLFSFVCFYVMQMSNA